MTKALLISVVVVLAMIAAGIYLRGLWPAPADCTWTGSRSPLADNLRQHVMFLADEIGERHYQDPSSLDRAAEYIRDSFSATGVPGSYQEYGDGFRNVTVTLQGKDAVLQDDWIVVGAHYDTVWLSPGADDNASGVAVLLELARLLEPLHLARTIQLVAFTNEEQPFAETEQMGSRVYLRQSGSAPGSIVSMYSLEMLGYYSDEQGSQQYPPPLSLFYPDTGNFVAFVANLRSAGLLLHVLPAFRRNSDFPVEGLVMSEKLVPDIRRSDHAQFWDAGIPALMLTDTANFRNNRYHTVGDLPHTLDYIRMAELTQGIACMLAYQAGNARAD